MLPGRALGHADIRRLQQSVGNATVQRALLAAALPGGRATSPVSASALVQRALLAAAVGGETTVSRLALNNTPYCVLKGGGIPDGYHVTIFPAFSDSQQHEIEDHRAKTGKNPPLGAITGHKAVTFTQFNVTREADGLHFYFNEDGVYWAKKPHEAPLDSPHWEPAVTAAAVVYGRIGVALGAPGLVEQLYRAGRKRPPPPVDPDASKKALAMVPRSLRGKLTAPPGVSSKGITKAHPMASKREAAKKEEHLKKVIGAVAAEHRATPTEDPDLTTT